MDNLIPADMTDAAMWAVIVGFFVPVVINFIVSATWSAATKAAVAFVVSAIAGAGTAFFTGAYAGLGIPSAILLTFVVAIASYSQFWKQVAPTMQRGAADKIERDAGGGLSVNGPRV
ncbi:membrane protein [Microbacterium phage Kozie]|uniref:Membrane protein n=1 Tax=Microbacterium phage Kozie TaxID=2885981 RepID=A0AAE8Y8B0_9CAUD|nr:membrane protein [Microbacterium phage Kozie]UDL16237.1 membrane protein [Microbacterium phage Kozie]